MSGAPCCDLWEGLEATDATHLITEAAQRIVSERESSICHCRQQEREMVQQVQQLQSDHEKHMQEFIQQIEEQLHAERAALHQEYENQVNHDLPSRLSYADRLSSVVALHAAFYACAHA
jgi:mevalonate kinase